MDTPLTTALHRTRHRIQGDPHNIPIRLTMLLLLLLLLQSHFSYVRICATPWTAAYQAPPSMGFPGKSIGVGCHFLLQCMKVKREREVTQSYPTLCDPMDCSLPGSSIHGISRQENWSGVPIRLLLLIIISTPRCTF